MPPQPRSERLGDHAEGHGRGDRSPPGKDPQAVPPAGRGGLGEESGLADATLPGDEDAARRARGSPVEGQQQLL